MPTSADPRSPASEAVDEPASISRRDFATGAVRLGAGLAAAAVYWPLGALADRPPSEAVRADQAALPETLLRASPFVYVSPLLADGRESLCHGELWYAWLDEHVVVTVAADRWKATALARGLDRARVWVGDHGRWKGWLGSHNEDFRRAPRFDARAERIGGDSGAAILERLLASYQTKYPDEIADWGDRMRRGQADGSRVLIRYRPIPGTTRLGQ